MAAIPLMTDTTKWSVATVASGIRCEKFWQGETTYLSPVSLNVSIVKSPSHLTD